MALDRTALWTSINELYRREHEEIGDAGNYRMLDEARRWDLRDTLATGDVIAFGHVNVADCGVHVAAAVDAALDSGADTVLAISVLHAFMEESSPAATCRQAVDPRRHIRRGESKGRNWISGTALHVSARTAPGDAVGHRRLRRNRLV